MLRKLSGFLLLIIIGIFIFVFVNLDDLNKKFFYPTNYSEYVEVYSSKNDMDKYLIYAIIKTESGFNADAESNVGARGLMQLMEDTFDWVKFRMSDDSNISYDDMYDPECNIKYGTYLIMLLYEEYGDYETAIAAYHTGRGNVNNWLSDKRYSDDGNTLNEYPSSATEHYVNKVMTSYKGYCNLYD